MADPALGPEGACCVKRMVTPSVLTPRSDPRLYVEAPITSHQNAIAASGSAELTWMCPAVTPRPPPGGCAMAERAVRKQTARKSMAVSNVINSRIEAGYRTIFRFSGVTSHNAICTALVALGEAGFPRRAR